MELRQVKIGSQVWATENLNVYKFRNGDPIPEVQTNEEWASFVKEGKPARCFFQNQKGRYESYGQIYNIHAITDERGLCPLDFRIPTKQDWEKLNNHLAREYLSGGSKIANYFPHSGGCRFDTGDFQGFAEYSQLWCVTKKFLNTFWYRGSPKQIGINLYKPSNILQHSEIKEDFFYKTISLAARCVNDSDGESNNDSELEFVFHSSDHIRYENGIQVSGPHGGAPRAIKVESNINGGEGYTVTLFNIDGERSSVQMAPKQMKLKQADNNKIELIGFGSDSIGASFADYGLTVFHSNTKITKCILHMFDRNIKIEYLE